MDDFLLITKDYSWLIIHCEDGACMFRGFLNDISIKKLLQKEFLFNTRYHYDLSNVS